MLEISALVSHISQDLTAATKFCNDIGLDGLDIDSVWGRPIEYIAGTEAARTLKKVLQPAKIKPFCLATGIFAGWLDSQDSFQTDLQLLQNCLEFAVELNIPLIRCFSFRKSADLGTNLPKIIQRLGLAAELCSKKGIFLGVQNEPGTFLATGKNLGDVIHSVGNPYLKAIWNPSAALFDLDDPEIPYPDGYRCLQPYIVHVMLSDIDRHKNRGSLCEVEFGEGIIDYRRQISSLLSDGFDGAVSFATQWHPGMDWDSSPDETDFTEKGGQAALRICLSSLQKMIRN